MSLAKETGAVRAAANISARSDGRLTIAFRRQMRKLLRLDDGDRSPWASLRPPAISKTPTILPSRPGISPAHSKSARWVLCPPILDFGCTIRLDEHSPPLGDKGSKAPHDDVIRAPSVLPVELERHPTFRTMIRRRLSSRDRRASRPNGEQPRCGTGPWPQGDCLPHANGRLRYDDHLRADARHEPSEGVGVLPLHPVTASPHKFPARPLAGRRMRAIRGR